MFALSNTTWRQNVPPNSLQSTTTPRPYSSLNLNRRRRGLIFLVILLSLSVLLFRATPSQAQENGASLSADAQAVVDEINRMRAASGIAPLTVHPQLVQAAQAHVGDMVANYNYSHTGSDGSNIGIRVARTGFQSSAGVSENWVAVGDPSRAVTWWMNSYVHRTNMLNAKWSHIGLAGRLDPRNEMHVFVAVFGTNGDGGATVTVAAAPQSGTVTITKKVPAGGMDYTVQPGDTLMAVALRYGVDWRTVLTINGLGEHDLLQIGQVVRLPGNGDLAPGIGGAAIADIPQDLKTSDYVVRSGDTLVGIGVRLGHEWQTIAALNGLIEQSVLQIGQVIKVPASEQGAATAASSAGSHTVQPGETVITIAAKYGIGWKILLEFNGLSDNSLLQIGQTLRLP